MSSSEPSKAALRLRAYRERKRNENKPYDTTSSERFERYKKNSKISEAERLRLYRLRKKTEKIPHETLAECNRLCEEENDEEPMASREVSKVFLSKAGHNTGDDKMTEPCTVRKIENVLSSSEEYCLAVRTLNMEQKCFILDIIYRIIYSKEPMQVFFTGLAGCGKTHTLKIAIKTINRFAQRHDNTIDANLATASTGKAAVAINGMTVHSALCISVSKQNAPLNNEKLQILRSKFRNIVSVIVEEVSMISAEMFEMINSRLQQLTEVYEPFGGLHLICCGDLRQLPPVRSTPIFKRTKRSKDGKILWQNLKFYPLTRVVRQSDTTFSSVLTKIGNGDALNEKEIKLIESRFVTMEEAKERAPNAIRLFHRSIDVDGYNQLVFNTPEATALVADDSYMGFKTKEQEDSARRKMHKMTVRETGGLPYKITLLEGKPYMITTNIDVTDGLVNGSVGKLKHIERDEDDRVKRLWLDFQDMRIGRVARAKVRSVYLNKSAILKSWTPVTARDTTVSFRHKTQRCKRRQIPLVEAAALTIHKSQGSTYSEAVYKYSKAHDQTLVYVALSRVKTLDGLYLTTDAQPVKVQQVNKSSNQQQETRIFHHVKKKKNKDLTTELRRLEQNELLTISKECKKFIESEQREFTLLTFNVKSLAVHAADIEQDGLLNTLDIMSLTETWLDDGKKIEISGYQCVNQHKRKNVRAGGVAIYERDGGPTKSYPHKLMKMKESDFLKISGRMLVSEDCGDICAIETTVNGHSLLVVSTYISPGTTMEKIRSFLFTNLLMYTPKMKEFYRKFDEDFEDALSKYTTIPIIFNGDFNLYLSNPENSGFIEFMDEWFDMKLKTDPQLPTTRNHTAIDHVFTRNIESLPCFNYVSYFSVHRPILSRYETDNDTDIEVKIKNDTDMEI